MRKRPSAVAQIQYAAQRDRFTGLSLADRFRLIHDSNLWAAGTSVSGLGSEIDATRALRTVLPELLRAAGVRRLLDVPCGDGNWMSRAPLDLDLYIGADLVPEVLRTAEQRTWPFPVQFTQLDLTRDPLPAADLLLCRDCLVHLSLANIASALANIRRSPIPWLLTTHFTDCEENRDIEDGDWRPLNFVLPPFEFPPPETLLVEGCTEAGGAYADKALALWRVDSLPRFH